MKLQNDARATELADGFPGLLDNDEDGYRLINVKHSASVFSEIHVCDEVVLQAEKGLWMDFPYLLVTIQGIIP
ncbi:Hypothetical predicted protein, partial [Paramuricea clavata]